MPQETSQFEWLVIALVYNHQYYDELFYSTFPNDKANYINMERQKNNLFDAFDDVPYSDDIKMVLVENRLKFSETEGALSLRNTLTVTEKVKGTGLRQHEHENAGKLQRIPDLDVSDAGALLTDGKALGTFLKNLIEKKNFTAERYILVTFGHGSVLGINLVTSRNAMQTTTGAQPKDDAGKKLGFRDGEFSETAFLPSIHLENALELVGIEKVNTLIDWIKSGEDPARVNKSFFKEKEFETLLKEANEHAALTNAELNIAIQNAFPDKSNGSKRLDLLVMFNCLMQNLYTQYEMRENVDILVAPQTGICYPGYDWRSVFEALTKQPNMTNEELAASFTIPFNTRNGFSTYYQTFLPDFTEDIEAWKLVSVKLEEVKLKAIKQAFTTFMNALTDACRANSRVSNYISTALAQCFNYTLDCIGNAERMIDLHCFCAELIKLAVSGNSLIKSLIPPAQALQDALGALTSCGSFIGKDVFKGKYFYIDMTNKESQPRSAGFLLQKHAYPANTVMNDMLSNVNKEFFPAFLENTGFDVFYKNYVS